MFRNILMAASLVVTLYANSAIAGTWLATQTAQTYAAEIFGDGTQAIDPGTAQYTLATTPASGAAFNVDYTLTGAVWGVALTSGSLTLNDSAVPLGTGTAPRECGTASITLVGGGLATGNTAKFRLDVTENFTAVTAAKARFLTLDYIFTGATGLNTPAGTVKLGVTLTDALGALDTAGVSTTIATSAEGAAGAVTAGTPANIDVASGNTKFVGATAAAKLTTALGSFNFANTAGCQSDGAGAGSLTCVDFNLGTAPANTAGGSAVITGDFSASLAVDADENALTNDGVAISGCLAANATTLTATTATFTLTDANIDTIVASAGCTVTMNIDGTTLLNPFVPSVALAADYANVDYRDEAFTGNLGALAKNGQSAPVDLILTPGGVFDGFVRVVNKSAVPGKVIVTLWNDAGASVSFDLADGVLAAQASTALVSADSLYTQAQAADATFAHNGGKLRASFEGEFSAIVAQSVTISTDNTTFTTF